MTVRYERGAHRNFWRILKWKFFQPKVPTEVGSIRQDWWAFENIEDYRFCYVTHRHDGSESSPAVQSIMNYGDATRVIVGHYGLLLYIFTKDDGWEAIQKLADDIRYMVVEIDILYKGENPYWVKPPKEPLVE